MSDLNTIKKHYENGDYITEEEITWLFQVAENAAFMVECEHIKDECSNECEIGYCMEYRRLRELFKK